MYRSALFGEFVDRFLRQPLAVRRSRLRLNRRYRKSERSVAIQSRHTRVDLDQWREWGRRRRRLWYAAHRLGQQRARGALLCTLVDRLLRQPVAVRRVGYDSTGGVGSLSDLWRYSPSTHEWTWISGGNGVNAAGVYGTQATASASNAPGARYSASSWIDPSGDLWLFGGYGYDATGTQGELNDLWEYVPSSGQWTWVGGDAVANAAAIFGTLGVASASDVPGGRQAANSWSDSSGNLWLFGGLGYDSNGGVGNLNDLWQYSPSNNEWTWFSGGTGAGTMPRASTARRARRGRQRAGRARFQQLLDRFVRQPVAVRRKWLRLNRVLGYLNDLWQYNPSAGS